MSASCSSVLNYAGLPKMPYTLCKKSTIHQVTVILSTSRKVIFPGHNHLLTTSADDPSLGARVIITVKGHQYRWLTWWLSPGNRAILEVANMVVTWWIVAFVAQCDFPLPGSDVRYDFPLPGSDVRYTLAFVARECHLCHFSQHVLSDDISFTVQTVSLDMINLNKYAVKYQ